MATTSTAEFSGHPHPAWMPPKSNSATTVISGASHAAPSILSAARHKRMAIGPHVKYVITLLLKNAEVGAMYSNQSALQN